MFQQAITFLAGVMVVFSAGVNGHSWIDELMVVGGSDAMIGNKGYTRNYLGHDNRMQWLIQPGGLEFDTPVCGDTNGQNVPGNYPLPQYPPLKAAPGDTVKGSYTENGHVSNLETPKSESGTTWWYGTTHPEIPTLGEVMKWTSDGKGGNGKGFMMAKADYDDSYCVEDRPNNPFWVTRGKPKGGRPCVSTFRIPQNLKPGQKLYVFWVWDFSMHLGEHRMEWYTSCMDIDIVDPAGAESAANDSHRRSLKYRSAKFAAALW